MKNIFVVTACDGLVPLKNPNSELQRCSEEDPCPAGYECNDSSYCCPSSENACNANMSRGNGCKGSTQRSMWFYDKSKKKCSQFVYNGMFIECMKVGEHFLFQAVEELLTDLLPKLLVPNHVFSLAHLDCAQEE